MRRKRKRASEPMSDETKALLAENKRIKRAEDNERRLKTMAERERNGAPTWRESRLRRYIDRVLALHGRDRLEFMQSNPVEGLFR